MCARAFAASVKRPVDSITTSTPRSFHGSFPGSRSAKTRMRAPVDGQPAVLSADVALVDAVVAVVLEEMGALLRVDEIVDRGDLDLGMALHDGLGEVSSDAAEAVDPDAHEPRLPGRFRASLPAAKVLGEPARAPSRLLTVGLAIGGLQRRPSSASDSSGCLSRSSATSRSAGVRRVSPYALSKVFDDAAVCGCGLSAALEVRRLGVDQTMDAILRLAQRAHVFEREHGAERADERQHLGDRIEIFVVEYERVLYGASVSAARRRCAASTSSAAPSRRRERRTRDGSRAHPRRAIRMRRTRREPR